MKSALAGTLERARSTFATISLGQKVVIGLLLAGLLLGGFYFYSWITTPTQAPLFSNLASTDASAIVDELNAEGVAYTLADGGGTIMVAKDKVYDLRLAMSGKGCKRKLTGDGKGAFAVRGRFATGTIGSARWTTTDSCKATTVKVARGKVRVGRRTVRKGRSVTVRR